MPESVSAVYRVLDEQMPHHAGAAAGQEVPARRLTERPWLRQRIELAARLYGQAPAPVLGTITWYSASSVLVAPALESLALAGAVLDPDLDAVSLRIRTDGRFAGAASAAVRATGPDASLASAAGAALGPTLEAVIAAIAEASGARSRALWAIAADSIGNRLLWSCQAAGAPRRASELAAAVAEGIGAALPPPRFTEIGERYLVHRVSCCLIDRATGGAKCLSCPNQHPEQRRRRILGA